MNRQRYKFTSLRGLKGRSNLTVGLLRRLMTPRNDSGEIASHRPALQDWRAGVASDSLQNDRRRDGSVKMTASWNRLTKISAVGRNFCLHF